MLVYTISKFNKLLKIDFIRFCIVGGLGFVVNFILLLILHGGLNINVLAAQLVSAEIALFMNFMLHHHWTYKSKKTNKTITTLIIQFHATTWPAILGSALMVSFFVDAMHFADAVALAISSAIALFWNFGWSKYVVWRDMSTSSKEIEQLVQ